MILDRLRDGWILAPSPCFQFLFSHLLLNAHGRMQMLDNEMNVDGKQEEGTYLVEKTFRSFAVMNPLLF